MKNNKLKLKFYLNASHAVMFEKDNISSIHGHTWEVILTLIISSDNMTPFGKVEDIITNYFDKYREEIINYIYPFTRINPSMENMGVVFFHDLVKVLQYTIYELETLEVLENPTRTYLVTSDVDYASFESDEYEDFMTKELNRARGIKTFADDNSLNKELNDVFTSISNTMIDIQKTQEKMLKREKRRSRIGVVFISIILIASSVLLLEYFKVIDILTIF